MHAIEIIGLSKTYKGKRGRKVDALSDLTFEIEQGEIFGFLGPNGAGKSTTIKALMGLIRPTSGSAKIAGNDITTVDARTNCGYLPENPAFYDYLSAEEYLSLVGRMFKMSGTLINKKSEQVLRQLELWDARKRPVRSYSKGMVQRLGIAQVLIHDPDVYILDEPMSGLDPIGRALVKDIILELKSRGKSVFFSTHITSDVEQVCDRVGIILKGRLQSVERVSTILSTGVLGYNIQIKTTDENVIEHAYVPKEDLVSFLDRVKEQGSEVHLIEPQRKNLEDFFLDIVKSK